MSGPQLLGSMRHGVHTLTFKPQFVAVPVTSDDVTLAPLAPLWYRMKLAYMAAQRPPLQSTLTFIFIIKRASYAFPITVQSLSILVYNEPSQILTSNINTFKQQDSCLRAISQK